MHLLFDIETDGLYRDVTCIHCVAIKDLDTDETFVFNDQGNQQPIARAITMLEDADAIVGHNVINYDIPVIQKFYGWFKPPRTLDTLVLSRLYHPDILKVDQTRNLPHMPLQLYGRHSLEAYGYRLNEYKGGFAKHTDWKEWSQDMEDYCVQDLKVTHKLWNHFQKKFLNGSN
jgi:DNA polymerase elongation subunit (family B)